MRILIAGCGEIGSKTGLELHNKGHDISGIKRNVGSIPKPIKPIAADLTNDINPGLLPADIDVVIYILAANGFNEQAYNDAYVIGAKNLIAALDKQIDRLKRFIFISSTSVYAQNQGQWVDEGSATEPESFNGQVMLAAEKQILELPNSLVVRFSGIYGPCRNRMLEQVRVGQLASSQPVIYSNRIHSDDCAGVLVHLTEIDEINDQLILASDHCPVSLNEIQTWLADQLKVAENAREYAIPKRRAGSKRISNKRLIESGYQFKFPDYRIGYQNLL